MEKEFVPYELAFKLKRLGFNEPCFGGFNDAGGLYIQKLYFQSEKEEWCSAPTFSQAFRWFREKYGLKSWIEELMVGNYIYEIRPHNLADYKEGEVYVYATYEEAELACLDKLLEIVESKSE